MTTRVIVVHGIGQHENDFHEAWKTDLDRAHPEGDFEVLGLWWDDQLDTLRSATARELLREFVLGVLVYALISEARSYLQTACAIRLLKLAPDGAVGTLIAPGSVQRGQVTKAAPQRSPDARSGLDLLKESTLELGLGDLP